MELLSYFILREDELQHVSCYLVIWFHFFLEWVQFGLPHAKPCFTNVIFPFFNSCPVWQLLQSEFWSECLWGQTHFTFGRSALYILYSLHLCFFYLFIYSFVFVVSIINFFMVWSIIMSNQGQEEKKSRPSTAPQITENLRPHISSTSCEGGGRRQMGQPSKRTRGKGGLLEGCY